VKKKANVKVKPRNEDSIILDDQSLNNSTIQDNMDLDADFNHPISKSKVDPQD